MTQAEEILALLELAPPKGHDKPCAACGRCYWHCECPEGHRASTPTTEEENDA